MKTNSHVVQKLKRQLRDQLDGAGGSQSEISTHQLSAHRLAREQRALPRVLPDRSGASGESQPADAAKLGREILKEPGICPGDQQGRRDRLRRDPGGQRR